MTDDEAIRAASDAIDAHCAANPTPAWPALPDGVRPQDFTEVWSGTLEHDPTTGETQAWFTPRTEPVRITYTSTAEASAALHRLMNAADKLVFDWPNPGKPEHRQAVTAAINEVERFFSDLTTPTARPVYRVGIRWWREGLELHVEGVGCTQSRDETDAEAMVRDLVRINDGIEPDAFDIEWTMEAADE